MKNLLISIMALTVLITLWVDTGIALPRAIAFVLKASGDVQYRPGTKGTWKRLRSGTRLRSGDRIQTGSMSLVSIVFTDDKSLMKIRSYSDVTIKTKKKQKTLSKRIFAHFGELWFKVTRNQSEFAVETPSGIAAVKGTEFYAIIGKDGQTTIIGIEGIVQLITRLGKALVKAGNSGTFDEDSAPSIGKTEPGKVPSWGDDSPNGDILELEFQDKDGNKKKLRIIFQP